jgi:hypothetical protein
MNEHKLPTIEDIEKFLTEYGWGFKKTTYDDNKEAIVSPLRLNEKEGVLLSFSVEGEFVMVSTVDFMNDVPQEEAMKIFSLNDTIKLVKLYPVSENPLKIEVGFELWAEAWNKDTFFAFMDMLCLAIETVVDKLNRKEITFTPRYTTFR